MKINMKIKGKLMVFPLTFSVLFLLTLFFSIFLQNAGFTSISDELENKRKDIEEMFHHRSLTIANLVAINGVNPLYNLEVAELNQMVSDLMRNESIMYAMFMDTDGKALTDDRGGATGKIKAGNPGETDAVKTEKGKDSLTFLVPVKIEGEKIGYLSIAFSTRELAQQLDKLSKDVDAVRESVSRKVTIILVGITGIGLLIGIFLAVIISHGILKQLGSDPSIIAATARKIADGDLTISPASGSKQDIGVFAAMMKMTKNLKGIIEQITSHSKTVSVSSEELSATSTQISTGITEQAVQIEQSATASSEISQTIMEVAKNANEASGSAKESLDIAKKGKSVVKQSVESMMTIAKTIESSSTKVGALGESSKQIGNIINVINDIAGQTNLLALNATIEAARAGEQGRGFAVVADEVRKLAEKTGQATEQITVMVNKIQKETDESMQSMDKSKKEVGNGVNMAEQSMASLEIIVKASQSCLDMIQSIATATEEQSAAVEEVTAGMENVSTAFKSSRESVSQINISANGLAQVSSELMSLVSWFKTDDSSGLEIDNKRVDKESRFNQGLAQN